MKPIIQGIQAWAKCDSIIMVRNDFFGSGKAASVLAWGVALGVFILTASDLSGLFERSRSTAKSEVFPVDPAAVAATIAGGHLFGSAEPVESAPPDSAGSSFTLQAVVAGMPGQPGWAVIAVDGGEQTGIVEGEEIVPGVTLANVAADRVVLQMAGGYREIFIDRAAATAAALPAEPAAQPAAAGRRHQ